MGDHEGWAQPSGLLPSEASRVTRPLNRERWLEAEDRTAELIACIQPNRPSEKRRAAVADYVQRLIQKCFHCQVFTFGSVPLKTYLPDGDIDLTAFSKQNLKDTWANEVRDILVSEERSEHAEFRVKEVQYIQAEVKIIKCLVENIVVDISFNQLGGLCTLCFLEEVDNLIGQSHLFKRSIILVKAWCYYESRILGAHHGLISTYALETLVLYIFHVFNNCFCGPLEVLYRFLEFFSNFDWENYCVSLWGPIPLISLPEMAAEPPRKDGGELLLNKIFLEACGTVYAVFPGGQETQGQSFVSKHFNVVDPLRTSNNLGRSVSKGNFFRIRSAFAFGARKLARLLECPRENIIAEIDQFFTNTWERHGKGQRPDAPSPDPRHLQPPRSDSIDNADNIKALGTFQTDDEEDRGNCTGQTQVLPDHTISFNLQGDGSLSLHGIPSQPPGPLSHPLENNNYVSSFDQECSLPSKGGSSTVSRSGSLSGLSKSSGQRGHHQQASTGAADQSLKCVTNDSGNIGKNQKGFRGDYFGSDSEEKGRFHFARPRSSPELTGVPNEISTRGRRNRAETAEAGRSQVISARVDHAAMHNSAVERQRKNTNADSSSPYTTKAGVLNDFLTLRRSSSQENLDTGNFGEASNYSNKFASASESQDSGIAVQREAATPVNEILESTHEHQDGQDTVNLIGVPRTQIVNRQTPQINLPLNFASVQLPVPIAPSVLAPMGYAPANLAGMVHTSLPLVDQAWGPGAQPASYSSVQFPQGPVPSPLPPYVLNHGMATRRNLEDSAASGSDKLGVLESHREEEEVHYDPGFWQKMDEHEPLHGSAGRLDMKGARGFHVVHSEPQLPNHEGSLSSLTPSGVTPGTFSKGQRKFVKDAKDHPLEEQNDFDSLYNPARITDDNRVVPNLKALPTGNFENSSLGISENARTGAAGKVSKLFKDKRGRGRPNANPEMLKTRETFSPSYGNANNGWQADGTLDEALIGDDTSNQDWHSFAPANASSVNHGDRYPSFLHDGRSGPSSVTSESAVPTHMVARNIGSMEHPHGQLSPLPGYDSGAAGSSDSAIPVANLPSVVMGSGSRQRPVDNAGVIPFAFYPTGPPFPFLTMLPLYNISADGGGSGDPPSQFDSIGPADESFDHRMDQSEHCIETSSSFDLGENADHADIFSSSNIGLMEGSSIEHRDDMKSDILNSDFISHWHNLQYGRLCQDTRFHGPVFYPSPFVIPPMYLQGHFPWDGPGRPLAANMNMFSQLVSYGHGFMPVTPLRPTTNRPNGNFQRFSGPNRLFSDELPRYRGGTGTYLPNPRQVSYRDRQSSGSRGNRGNYGQDRNDHGDRETGWVFIPKNRGAGRGQNKYDARNQTEKLNSRIERNSEGKGGERIWDSYRNDNIRRGSYQMQHGPFGSGNSTVNTGNLMPHASGGTSYGMYPLQTMNSNGNMPAIAATGPAVPSVVMLYPYDHTMAFSPDHLEFGSLGPVQFGGTQEVQFNDSSARLKNGGLYEQRHNSYQANSSPVHSPSDQPSSPKQHQRSSQRTYQLKEEDFPPLSFRNQSGRGGSNSFNMGSNSNSRSSHYQAFLVTPSS